MTAPTYRSRCQLTGNPGESCGHADELATIGESIAQAVGFYDCPCGAEFELDSFDGIEAYAALNRWLGVHFGSGCMAETRVRELDAVCKAQAAEIRSLKTQRAQSWRVTGAVEVTMTLTLVSLFDGIGGFPLAFERAGAETVATVEIDDAAAKISHRHFPHAHQFTDVTKVTGDDLRTVGFVPERGIITAGWPCQDLSVAGRREGLAGARSGLWWHVVRLLAETQPRWFVGENVPGLLSSNGGQDFGAVLGSLAELGYGFAYRILDAQHFGVPQRRRRVFIVGHLGEPFSSAAEVLFEPESGDRDSASGDTAGAGVADSVAAGVGAACCATGHTHTHTLTASAAKMASEDGTGRGIPIVTGVDLYKRGGGRRDGTFSACWQRQQRRDQQQAGTSSFNRNVVAALTSNGVGTVGPDDNQAQAGHLVRRLTEMECERLQGYPDDWTAGQSGAARYRQLGNSVAVPVVQWIAERLITVDKEQP